MIQGGSAYSGTGRGLRASRTAACASTSPEPTV
jgi:hypothetical protein